MLNKSLHTSYRIVFTVQAAEDVRGRYSLVSLHTYYSDSRWKEAFSLFDKRGDGHVNKNTLGDLLRAIGQNPTQAEVAEVENGVKSDVDFDQFVKIAKRPDGFRPAGEPEDLIKGFQIFDKEHSGYIGVGELRYGNAMFHTANCSPYLSRRKDE